MNLTRKTLMTILVLILCAMWLSACDEIKDYFSSKSFVEVAAERTKLMNGLESYMSIDEARGKLSAWEVLEQRSLKPNDKRPPFNIYRVAVKSYSHLGVAGELQLEFFNSRLVSTWFYPEDFNRYIALLKNEEGIVFQESRDGTKEATTAPYTRTWTYKDYKELQYVGWEDTRLRDELNLWIKRYS